MSHSTCALRRSSTRKSEPVPQPLFSFPGDDRRQVSAVLPWNLVRGPVRVPDQVKYFSLSDASLITGKSIDYLALDYRSTWPTIAEELSGTINRILKESR